MHRSVKRPYFFFKRALGKQDQSDIMTDGNIGLVRGNFPSQPFSTLINHKSLMGNQNSKAYSCSNLKIQWFLQWMFQKKLASGNKKWFKYPMFFFQCLYLSHGMSVMTRLSEFSPFKQFSDTPGNWSIFFSVHEKSKCQSLSIFNSCQLALLLCYTGTFCYSRASGRKECRNTHAWNSPLL